MLVARNYGKTNATWADGDFNNDVSVGFDDLVLLARNYGQTGTFADGDFNNDGSVGFDDLVILARHYGRASGTGGAAGRIADVLR